MHNSGPTNLRFDTLHQKENIVCIREWVFATILVTKCYFRIAIIFLFYGGGPKSRVCLQNKESFLKVESYLVRLL